MCPTRKICYISSGENLPPLARVRSLQAPVQLRCRQGCAPLGAPRVPGVSAACSLVPVAVAVTRGGVIVVIVPGCAVPEVLSAGSQQPQNLPGVSQVLVDVAVVAVVVDVVVTTGAVVVVLSLHQNQPGVSQVEVDDVDVDVDDDVVAVAVPVVSSRHPHHPGVLQVEVRVRVRVEVLDWLVVVLSVPLLSYIFHGAQSRHSGVKLHSGTSSYFRITSEMTARILCVPMPTRHPLSATTSQTHSRPV